MFTVAHLIDSFLASERLLVAAGQREATTLRWHADMFKKLKPLGGFPAHALKLYDLSAIKLTNGFTRALKQLYKWAADEDLVPKDPFAKLTIPPCGQRERVLDRDELARLYRVCRGAFRRFLFVMFNTTARPGEIRQLTWGQIDWEKRVMVLVKFKGKKRRREKVKARAIGIPRHVLRLLKNLHRKSPDPSPSGSVLLMSDGRPWTSNALRCRMRRARAKAGLENGGERVVCYTLRHTSATEYVRSGEDLKHLAEVMGHARTTTTERYVHLNTADVVAAVDRFHSSRPRRSPASSSATSPAA